MMRGLLLLLLPSICFSQYFNPYQAYGGGLSRHQTVLVPVYTQGGMYGGGGYGMNYPSYGMYQGYPGMGYDACCGGATMPHRESNAKKFLRGATEGVFMGSIGMLGFRK